MAAKNRQVVIELHEGCIAPADVPFNEHATPEVVRAWLLSKLQNEPDCILIDKVSLIDCDCEVDD